MHLPRDNHWLEIKGPGPAIEAMVVTLVLWRRNLAVVRAFCVRCGIFFLAFFKIVV
jgi:hypothetical protein